MPRDQLGKEPQEGRDDFVADEVVNLPQDLNGWPLGGYGSVLWERYVKGRLNVHIHFALRIDRSCPEPGYFCLSLNYPRLDFNHSRQKLGILGPRSVEYYSRERRGNNVQQAVLIDSRQLMKYPEGFADVLLPCLVRLHPLDDCLSKWIHSLNLGETASGLGNAGLGFGVEPRASGSGPAFPVNVSEDRELRGLCNLIGQRLDIGPSQFEGEIIQSASQIVKAIRDEKRDGIERRILGLGIEDEMVATFGVGFRPRTIAFAIEPSAFLNLELLQITMRPGVSQDEGVLS